MSRIICDFYHREGMTPIKDNPEYSQRISAINSMYGWLYYQGILQKASLEFRELPSGACFALDTQQLAPYRTEMEHSGAEDADIAIRHIFDEEYTPCVYSGMIQLTSPMFTYRNVDGCVGRSWECDLIKYLTTDGVYRFVDVKREEGQPAAIKALFDCFDWPSVKRLSLSENIHSVIEKHSYSSKESSCTSQTKENQRDR